MTFQELDSHVSIRDQLAGDASPVVLINVFSVDPAESDALLRAWAEDATYFKSMPGFISAQLHRGIAGSGAFLNYAVWESVRQFSDAFSSPDFQGRLKAYPPSTVASPHLFAKVAVPGICEG